MKGRIAWLSSILVLAFAGTAHAEPPLGEAPAAQPVAQPVAQPTAQPVAQPAAQPVYAEQQPVQQQPVEQAPRQGRGIEYGGHIIVPIWLTEPSQMDIPIAVSPGIGIQGRIGWEFPGGLTTELNVGGMVNALVDYDETVNNVWLGLGARYAFFNPSAFVPFIGAGIKLNFWEFCDAEVGGVGACDAERQLTFGFQGLVGAAFELSPFLALEGGVQVDATLPGNVFDETQIYLSPFAGATLYY